MSDNDIVGTAPVQSIVTEGSTERSTKGGRAPAGLRKIRGMTDALDYLASAGPPKAVGLSQAAQNLWFRLMLMGGPLQGFGDGRSGVVVSGRLTRLTSLATTMGCSEASAKRAVKELREAGIIVRKRRIRGCGTRVILPDAAVAKALERTTKAKSDPVHRVTGDPQSSRPEPMHQATGVPVHQVTGDPMMIQAKVQSKVQNLGTEPPNHGDGMDGGGDAAREGRRPGWELVDAERLLRHAGVVPKEAATKLARQVVDIPDGVAQLREAVDELRGDPKVRNPGAVLRRRIEEGNILGRRRAGIANVDAARPPQRPTELLRDRISRIADRIDDLQGDGQRVFIPPILADLLGMSTPDRMKAALEGIRDMEADRRAKYLDALERGVRVTDHDEVPLDDQSEVRSIGDDLPRMASVA